MYQTKAPTTAVRLLLYSLCKGTTLSPGTSGLQEDAEQNEGDADIEREINLTTLAEDEEGEDDGVAGLEVVGQIDSEGRQTLQGLNLQEVHTDGTEQSVAEHEPKIRALGYNND